MRKCKDLGIQHRREGEQMRTKDNGKNNAAKDIVKKKHTAFTWFKRMTVVLCAVVMYFAVTIGVRGYDMYKDAIAQVSLEDKVKK